MLGPGLKGMGFANFFKKVGKGSLTLSSSDPYQTTQKIKGLENGNKCWKPH